MPQPRSQLKILLVDDELMVLRALKRCFVEQEVLTAENYDQALDILQRETVNVVISDCTMPGPSGVEVLRAAARLQPQARRFMCSARPPLELLTLQREGVIERFFLKPWDDSLIVAVQEVARP